jgi:Zn-dependent protease/CBS domain-containing protein
MEPPPEQAKQRETSFLPGSIAVVRVFGVPIRFHFTFVLLFLLVVFAGLGDKQSGLSHMLYIAALFGSVLLHEIGHAVVGRRCGVKTLEIVMFPIGGVSRLERQPRPGEEFWIALAGPVVNLLIAGGLLGWLASQGRIEPLEQAIQPTDANLLERIALGNLLLAVFNLLPAFPMDGGRILRSLLALKRSEDQASRLAARAGQFLAIAMGLYGLLAGNYLLVFVAFFVWAGAWQEGTAAVGRMLTHGLPVRAAMVREFRTLVPGSTIRDAADLLLATAQQDFPVVHGSQVIGLLGRSALLRAMATDGPDGYVTAAMNREFVRVTPDQDLAATLPALQRAGPCALVMDGETLLGLLTAENVAEFLLLRQVGLPIEGKPDSGG